MTLLFPCVTFGQIAEIVDRGSTSCGASAALYTLIVMLTGSGFQSIYSCFYRSKLRAQYGVQESPCHDCCVHFFCEWCALCQEYRELNNRGFQMSLGTYSCYTLCSLCYIPRPACACSSNPCWLVWIAGWHGNMDKQGRAAGATMPPQMHHGMTR